MAKREEIIQNKYRDMVLKRAVLLRSMMNDDVINNKKLYKRLNEKDKKLKKEIDAYYKKNKKVIDKIRRR